MAYGTNKELVVASYRLLSSLRVPYAIGHKPWVH
jgi:hypothetical protein